MLTNLLIEENMDMRYDEYNIGRINLVVLEKQNYDCVIIQSDDKVNPTEYTKYVYSKIVERLNGMVKGNNIYLDLSNLYGIKNKDWLYKWVWKTKNGDIEDEYFERLDKISKINENEYDLIREYLYDRVNNLKHNMRE